MLDTLTYYKDVIIHCLDLFSFLFVTPELLRYTGWAAAGLARFVVIWLTSSALFLALLMPIVFVPKRFEIYYLVLACLPVPLIFLLVDSLTERKIQPWIGDHILIVLTRYGLYIGILIFLISRALGLVIAIAEMTKKGW